MRYPHHDLVLAWLSGEAIQYFEDGLWRDMPSKDAAEKLPHFYRTCEYRKKPIVLRYRLARAGASVVAVNTLQEERALAPCDWIGDWVEVAQ